MTTYNQFRPMPILGFIASEEFNSILRVCFYCAPGKTAFELMPSLELEGHADLSHGICRYHLVEAYKELFAKRALAEAEQTNKVQ